MVVVLKFGIGEEFVPVILVLIAKEVEILFQLLVYMLRLAVGLSMVGSGGVKLYSKQLVGLLGELCHELQSLIQNIGVREAMELPDVCSSHGGAGGVGWNEVHSLPIQIYHHHDYVIIMDIGELDNEVHGCYAPLFHGHWGESALGLGPEAEIAGAGVGFNVSGHLGPPVVLGH
ncbi:hypothetical protein J132_00572 [Termitomyces sp. J132]|nr:hypothetical protein J132_00572 [Termitomyces sp. J132]